MMNDDNIESEKIYFYTLIKVDENDDCNWIKGLLSELCIENKITFTEYQNLFALLKAKT